jgi:hypothetical protein
MPEYRFRDHPPPGKSVSGCNGRPYILQKKISRVISQVAQRGVRQQELQCFVLFCRKTLIEYSEQGIVTVTGHFLPLSELFPDLVPIRGIRNEMIVITAGECENQKEKIKQMGGVLWELCG